MARTLLLLFLAVASFSGTLATSSLTAAVVGQLFSLFKWTPKSPPKTSPIDSSVLQFESGYLVETIAEGSKLGMTPHSIRVSPEGELVAVDSINSNIVRITPPLSSYSRARLIAGSFQGQTGHIDGKPSDARFRNPKSVAMDRKGNIYVADTSNLAIRKIGESGVTTIAGGKSNVAGYRDGPSEDARFSSDFDLIYVGSICSLIVVDRGNAALRQIFLQDDDCSKEFSSIDSSDIVMVLGAVFVGYLSCIIQHGFGASFIKKALTFGGQPRPLVAEKLKSEGDATWASCQQIFSNLCRLCVDFIPRGKSKSTLADQKQKNVKPSVQRDPVAPTKHRRRQEFAEFYGLTSRHHEVKGPGSTSRPVEVNSAERKFDHFHSRSKYSSPDARHQARSGQRGD